LFDLIFFGLTSITAMFSAAVAWNITVQHGSADTVVRAMNVKYRKWRLGIL